MYLYLHYSCRLNTLNVSRRYSVTTLADPCDPLHSSYCIVLSYGFVFSLKPVHFTLHNSQATAMQRRCYGSLRTNWNQKGTGKKRSQEGLILGLFFSIANFKSGCSQSNLRAHRTGSTKRELRTYVRGV